MVKANDEVLRDWRTGLLPSTPEALVEQLLLTPHGGARSPYEMECALGSLARVLFHLLHRVAELEGRSVPAAAARTTSRIPEGLTPKADARAWQRRPADLEKGEAAKPTRTPEPTEGQRRTLADVIDGLLRRDPARWWTPKELSAAVTTGRLFPGRADSIAVSTTCTERCVPRGWQKRTHPQWSNRRQYAGPAAAPVSPEPQS